MIHAAASARSIYGEACSILSRLCPRPSPSGLEEVRLRLLASADPVLVAALSGAGASEAAEAVREAGGILSELGSGKCGFCGKKAEAAAELWNYLVHEEGYGVAVLEAVVPACRKCLETLVSWDRLLAGDKRLLKHLAKVNKVGKDEALAALAEIKRGLEEAERVGEWLVSLQPLRRSPARSIGELFLARVARGAPAARDGLLVAEAGTLDEALLAPSVDRLCGNSLAASTLAQLALQEGLEPNWHALEEYLSMLRLRLCRGLHAAPRLLESAWILRLRSREARAVLFAVYVELMSSGKEDVWATRAETPVGPADWIRVYTPSFADPGLVRRVLEEALSLLPQGAAALRDPPILVPRDPGSSGLWRHWLFRWRPRSP